MNWDINPFIVDISLICRQAQTSLEEIRQEIPVPPLHITRARMEIIHLLHDHKWPVADIADFLFLEPETVEYAVQLYERFKRSPKRKAFVRSVLQFIRKGRK